MHVSKQELEQLASLARLDLDDDKLMQLEHELERILGYVGRLSTIDTAAVSDAEMEDIDDRLRSDAAAPADALTRQLILQNFPDHVGEALRVPAIFENPKA